MIGSAKAAPKLLTTNKAASTPALSVVAKCFDIIAIALPNIIVNSAKHVFAVSIRPHGPRLGVRACASQPLLAALRMATHAAVRASFLPNASNFTVAVIVP
jgi:hypothetical protein